MKDRFDQPGYGVYCKLEELLVKASSKEDFIAPLDFVCSFYKEDFNPDLLCSQLLTFGLDFQAAYKEEKSIEAYYPGHQGLFQVSVSCSKTTSRPSMPSCAANSGDASYKCNI